MASHNALLTATQTNIGIDGSELTSDSALAKCSDIEAARVALARTLAPSVVFIDSAVDDIGTLIAGVQPNVRVFVLDSDTDGVEQIVAVLQAQPDVGEIHIVSHGEPGCLYLGNTRLSAGTIGHYTQAFSALKALSHVPPLLLYGCNLAAGDVGGEFLEKLHQITNLPIAASRTKVGDGGTWALDVTAGTLTRMPQLPFTQETRSSYTGAFANAQLVRDINPTGSSNPSGYNTTVIDGQLFFTADDGVTGRELWVSDGTEEGTQLVRDINPDNGNYPAPTNFIEVGGQLFFTADDGVIGRELWVSDGTEEGTQLVRDINPNNGNDGNGYYYYVPAPTNFIEVGGQLFFTASDGVTGRELWGSDGTEEGTQLVRDINPNSNDDNGYYYYAPAPYNFIEVGGQLFFTASDGATGRELWVSDGTEEGTRLVKDINPSSDNYPAPYNFTEVGGQLFFTADDGVNGRELWVSDGTEEGTQLVRDINPDNSNSNGYYYYSPAPRDLTAAGDLLFFTADDGIHGRELWISDGTTEGTQLFQDINPGNDGSFPDNFNIVDNQLFFTADDGTTGEELWVVSIPDNVVSGDDTDNVLNGTAGSDLINGLGGNDVIRARGGDDIVFGGEDDDVLFGNGGNDALNGGSGNDQIFGDRGDDTLQGGAGDDALNGGGGNDTVVVNDFSGNDIFDGGGGTDLIRFEPADGRDLRIFLDQGAVGDGRGGGQFFENFEQIATGRGNDRILGDTRSTLLDSGDGNDTILGGSGRDTLLGSNGQDELRGEQGRDELIGGTGRDTLLGGGGADTLIGGQGDDVLIGEGGADTFRFERDLLDGQADTDTIQTFQSQDILDFDDYLSAGGSITVTRVTSGLLRLDLSSEDIVNVFGNQSGLDAAEIQLASVLESLA